MPNTVADNVYIARSFDAICEEMAADGQALVRGATAAADAFAADLADYLDNRLGFFDRDERVAVVAGPVERSDVTASMSVRWKADSEKRLLPNVEATIVVSPIITRGPSVTSMLTLRGRYDPPRSRRRHPVQQAIARRVLDATLHTFLRHLAGLLDSQSSDPEPQPSRYESAASMVDDEVAN